jgi:hypothetical protein
MYRGSAFRKAVLMLSLCTLSLQWGCYSYLPVQSAPPPVSEKLAVALNDRGRILLGDRLGGNIDRVEGVLVSSDSAGIVMDVSGIKDLRGGSAVWSGERVSIPNDAIMGFRPRKLSKARSLLLAGAVVGVIALVTFGLSLDLFGTDTDDGDVVDGPGGGGGTSFRR